MFSSVYLYPSLINLSVLLVLTVVLACVVGRGARVLHRDVDR